MNLTRTAHRLTAGAAIAALLALGGCAAASAAVSAGAASAGAASAGAGSAGATPVASSTHYAVFPAKVPGPGWQLNKSIRPIGGARDFARSEEPGLDWWSEYEGPGAHRNARPDLMLIGSTNTLEEQRHVERAAAADVTSGRVSGRPAFWSADSTGGAFVAISWADDYTVTLSGQGLSLEALRQMAGALRGATESEWTSAGGRISDCMPFQTTDCMG